MPRKSLIVGANRNWLLAGAALIAATGVGFTAAKLTSPKSPSATEATSAEGEAEGTDHAADGLVMTAERITSAGIQLQPVATGGLASEILAQATVTAQPGGEAVLTARAAGSIARITKRLGDSVRAGETLALVESREASQIAAARSTAAAKAELARKVYAREQRLYEQKVSPRQDMEAAQAELAAAEAEARSANLGARAADVTSDGRYVAVASPISGRITDMSASLGAFVQPETELFRVSDPSKVQVEAAVGPADAARLAAGDQAIVELADGRTLNARVRSITPGLGGETRQATVVVDVTASLPPGLAVTVRLLPKRESSSGAIVIPDEALQSLEGRDVVFVRTAQGFTARKVTVGQRSAGRVEITAGLKPEDTIATRNAFLLKAELGKGEGGEH